MLFSYQSQGRSGHAAQNQAHDTNWQHLESKK